MGKVYRIKNWNDVFENNRTRELKRLEWVPVPNKMDGDGYTELVTHPNGAAHLGAWLAIVEVASKCDVRGTLSRDGATCQIGHDSESLSRITRLPASVFDEVIPRLERIGWLVSEVVVSTTVTTIPHEGAAIPHEGAAKSQESALNGREWNGRERGASATSPKKVPNKGPHVASAEHYQEAWKAKYGADKCVLNGREWKAIHALHGIVDGDTDRLNKIIDTFLDSPKPYYRDRGHKLHQLLDDINDFLATGPPRLRALAPAIIHHEFQE